MKLLQAFLSLLLLGACAFSADLAKLLSEAQVAMLRGDLETAQKNFQIVYQLDQKNTTAIAGLRQIKIEQARKGNSSQIEKQLAAVVIPQIRFQEATLPEALDFLKKKVAETSGGKQSTNFVIQPGVDQNAKITLSLSNIPVTEALRYVGDLVNSKIEYQQYAIVIKPAGGQ